MRAAAAGITVNGLTILNEDPNLDRYYLSRVIVGADAFVLVADDYEDFGRAIRLKLITEITGSPMALLAAPATLARLDPRDPPGAYRLVADIDTALVEQVFDLPQ